MNKTSAKTSAKKDEALKMAIEFMGTLTIDVGIKTWNEKHRKEAIQACKEALETSAKWQGLSDDEIEEIVGEDVDVMYSGDYEAYRAIEQALKEKNHVTER